MKRTTSGRTAAVLAAIACTFQFVPSGCVSASPGSHEHRAATTSVLAGEHFSFELPFRAGTGYAWTATGFDAARILTLVSQESRVASTEPSVGGPMTEQFVFRGVAPGRTTVRFELRRPWERDVSPVETRDLSVTVTMPEAY